MAARGVDVILATGNSNEATTDAAATKGGFVLTALSNARQSILFSSPFGGSAPPIKP